MVTKSYKGIFPTKFSRGWGPRLLTTPAPCRGRYPPPHRHPPSREGGGQGVRPRGPEGHAVAAGVYGSSTAAPITEVYADIAWGLSFLKPLILQAFLPLPVREVQQQSHSSQPEAQAPRLLDSVPSLRR